MDIFEMIFGGHLRRGQQKTKKLFTLDPANVTEFESFSIRERQIGQRFEDLKLDVAKLETDRKLWWRMIKNKNNLIGKDVSYVNGEVHEIVPEDQEGPL